MKNSIFKRLNKRVLSSFFIVISCALGMMAGLANAADPVMVQDINPAGSSSPDKLVNINGTVYFRAYEDTHGYELWKSDESGTSMVKDIIPGTGSGYPDYLTNINGTLYFAAEDGVHGQEIWKSDGTSDGTVMVKDINPGDEWSHSYPHGFTYVNDVNGTIYFIANDGSHGEELWKSDGTSGGTVLVKDIRSGSDPSMPDYLTNLDGTLYFMANDGTNGAEFWKSTGTSGGTVMVKDIWSGSDGSEPSYITNVDGTLFFKANDGSSNGNYQLWKSDGTSAETVMVKNIYPAAEWSYSSPANFFGEIDLLFFTGTDGIGNVALWRSDGTSSGTYILTVVRPDLYYGPYWQRDFLVVEMNGYVYFPTTDNGLMRSDGTIGNTNSVSSKLGWGIDSAASTGNALFFRANSTPYGAEIWTSNGTENGTGMVKDINPGASSAFDEWSKVPIVNAGGTIYFPADDGTNGVELWKLVPPVTLTCHPDPTSTITSDVGYYDVGTVAIDDFNIGHTINVAYRGDAFPWDQRYTYSSLDFGDLISSSGGNMVAKVPKVVINSYDTMVPVQVEIPQCATITSDSGWDGTIGEPRDSGGNITPAVLAEIATPGKTAILKYAMEIGDYYYHTYSLDKAIRITLGGQAGYTAGYFTRELYYTYNNIAKIPTQCSDDTQVVGDALPARGNCWIDVGGDKVIWTKYMNEFFTYEEIDPTTVTNVNPDNGTSLGGSFVTITGTGFREGATVNFGDASSVATDVVVIDDTTITAVTPAHFVSTMDVSVRNSDGTYGVKTNGFTFNGSTPTPPVVSTVVPDNGIYSGGTLVTVSGSNFTAPVTVIFGTSAVGGTFIDSSTITVTTPSYSVGKFKVAVKNPDASIGVLQRGFDFTPGGIPSSCPSSAGNSSTVDMNESLYEDELANFNTEKTYNIPSSLWQADIILTPLIETLSSFKTARMPKIKINYNSSTHGVVVDIPQCTTANSDTGWVEKIRTPKEKAKNTVSAYLNSIRPAGGGLAAVESVISMGDSSQRITFDRAVRIKFIGMAGKKIGYVSGYSITKISNTCSADTQVAGDALPAGGDCSMDVGDDKVVWTKHFTDFVIYDEENPPTVTGVTPDTGSQNGGTHVTVAGTNFGTGATVTFGGTPGTNVDVLNNTQIAIDTPAHAAGAVDVVVTNPNMLQGTKTDGFTYVDYTPGVAPAITDINPNSGDVTGNTHVTITGTNFGTGLGVTFGGSNAAHVSVDNNTQIQLDTPPHAAGAVDVTVTNPDSMPVTSTGGFTFTQSGGGTQQTQEGMQPFTQEIICPQNPVFTISKTPDSVNWQDKTVSSQEIQSYDKLLGDDTPPPSANLMTVSDYRSGGADECPLTSRGFVVTAQLSADLTSTTDTIPKSDVRIITSNEGLTNITGEDAVYSVADNTGNRHNVSAPVLYDDYLRDPLVSFAKFNQPDPYAYLAVSGGNATNPSGTPGSGTSLNNAFSGIVTLLSTSTSHHADISTNVVLKLAIPGNTDPGVYTGTITYTLMAQ